MATTVTPQGKTVRSGILPESSMSGIKYDSTAFDYLRDTLNEWLKVHSKPDKSEYAEKLEEIVKHSDENIKNQKSSENNSELIAQWAYVRDIMNDHKSAIKLSQETVNPKELAEKFINFAKSTISKWEETVENLKQFVRENVKDEKDQLGIIIREIDKVSHVVNPEMQLENKDLARIGYLFGSRDITTQRESKLYQGGQGGQDLSMPPEKFEEKNQIHILRENELIEKFKNQGNEFLCEGSKVSCVVQINNSHWVEMDFAKSKDEVRCLYKDPMGLGMNGELIKNLNEVFNEEVSGKKFKIIEDKTRYQEIPGTCGLFALAYACTNASVPVKEFFQQTDFEQTVKLYLSLAFDPNAQKENKELSDNLNALKTQTATDSLYKLQVKVQNEIAQKVSKKVAAEVKEKAKADTLQIISPDPTTVQKTVQDAKQQLNDNKIEDIKSFIQNNAKDMLGDVIEILKDYHNASNDIAYKTAYEGLEKLKDKTGKELTRGINEVSEKLDKLKESVIAPRSLG